MGHIDYNVNFAKKIAPMFHCNPGHPLTITRNFGAFVVDSIQHVASAAFIACMRVQHSNNCNAHIFCNNWEGLKNVLQELSCVLPTGRHQLLFRA